MKARIAELSARVDQAIARAVILSKDGVLEGITETIELARAEKKYADMLRGYELLGKHHRLFDRAAEGLSWNGDPSTLTEEQLEALCTYLERIAFNGDKAKIEEARKRAMIEAGHVIDVESELVENKEEVKDGW